MVQAKHNCKFYHSKIEKYTHFPQKVYKLSKAKFSRFEGTRGDKNQIFRPKMSIKLLPFQRHFFSKIQLQIENSEFVKTCDEYVHGQVTK